jgi:hypothetical protein
MPKLGQVGADAASISLAPKVFPLGSWLQEDEVTTKPETYLWFQNRDYVSPFLATMARPGLWRVGRTPLVLALSQGKAPPEELLPWLEPVSTLEALMVPRRGRAHKAGFLLLAKDGPWTGCSTRFLALQPGNYRAHFGFEVLNPQQDKATWWLRVLAEGGQRTLSQVTVDLHKQKSRQELDFEITQMTQGVEIVVELPLGADVLLKDFELTYHR